MSTPQTKPENCTDAEWQEILASADHDAREKWYGKSLPDSFRDGEIRLERKFVPAPKPAELTGPMSQAWDYLVNRNGVCETSQFDDDFHPIGAVLRVNLVRYGVQHSTSGKITIVFLPEKGDL